MSTDTRHQAARDIVAVLPDRAHDVARLQTLAEGGEPVITVVGKYNHGKSRLLNELIGQDVFAVADRRETVALADSLHRGVRWLDAPGLDADVACDDDRHALRAAWLESDIRLFVHAAKEGELDASELALLGELQDDGARTQRHTLFVLTQVDQLASDIDLESVSTAIGVQMPGVALNAVSATRHRKGLEGGKALLLEKSGIPAMRGVLEAALARVPVARQHEAARLFDEIHEALLQVRAEQEGEFAKLHQAQQQQRQTFEQGLKAVIEKVGGNIGAMLAALDSDHALIPDTARDAYAITAGKLERAHIQIGYSRACIEIDSFLAGHGVTGVPQKQQTVAHALNSVMVAVMGVSVKFRKDLQRMFCEAAGRERLLREFIHYYELSADRQALRESIAGTESLIAASARALAALHALKADA